MAQLPIDMAALDWIFAGVLTASMLIGAWRGFVYEVLSVLGWMAAFFAAQWFGKDAASLLPMGESGNTFRYAMGFVVVFVVTVFVCGVVAWAAKKLIEFIGLRPADRMLGAAFGLIRGVVLLLVAAVLAGLTPIGEAAWWQESQGASLLLDALRGLGPLLPNEFVRHLPV